MSILLEIKELSFGYVNNIRLFENFSMTLSKGEVKAVIGPSGRGKSTLFELILGTLQPDDGEIYSVTLSQVFQDPYSSFHPSYTIRQQIKDVSIMDGYERYLAKMGLKEENLDVLPHQLSGGQLQRCSILRALLMRPQLLLLDEPTSALDNLNQLEIMKILMEELNEMGILLITHDLGLAKWCADEIISLESDARYNSLILP